MKKTVIKYMVPKEVIFEDGEDLGKRIVQTAKLLGADTYHHVKMLDDEKQEAEEKYYEVVVERDFVGWGRIWILASSEDEAVEVAQRHSVFTTFNAENMEMNEVGDPDRYSSSRDSVHRDEMPNFIKEKRARGEEIILDQDVIEVDDGDRIYDPMGNRE